MVNISIIGNLPFSRTILFLEINQELPDGISGHDQKYLAEARLKSARLSIFSYKFYGFSRKSCYMTNYEPTELLYEIITGDH